MGGWDGDLAIPFEQTEGPTRERSLDRDGREGMEYTIRALTVGMFWCTIGVRLRARVQTGLAELLQSRSLASAAVRKHLRASVKQSPFATPEIA